MPAVAPLVDKRSLDDLVAQTENLLQRYSDWQCVAPRPETLLGRVLAEAILDPIIGEEIASGTLLNQALAQRISLIPGLIKVKVTPVPDTGGALVRIFARLAEIAIDRLNQAPEKNFLAFLNLLGIDLLPPQAARVPLTFHLAAGSTADARVPARTQVAAMPLEGDTEPVVFETERDLVVTRSNLVAAFARDPGHDLYGNHTDIATGAVDGAFAVFQGDRPIEHRLYLGHGRLFGLPQPKTITLLLTPADDLEPWLAAVDWTIYDGADLLPLAQATTWARDGSRWKVTLNDMHAIPTATIGKQASAWLCGRLRTPLPRGEMIEDSASPGRSILRQSNLAPDAGSAETVPLDFSQACYPFGRLAPLNPCYLACDVAFGKPGAQMTIDVFLDPNQTAQPSANLQLAWEYWDGAQWQALGHSSPVSPSTGASPSPFFADNTLVFKRSGAITFRCPAGWTANRLNDISHLWLRVRIENGNYGTPANFHPPCVQRFTLRYEWPLPQIDAIEANVRIVQASLAPDLMFANQVQVDATKDFFPFGEKPKFNDTLYLAVEQAFSLPGARVTLTVTLTNPPGSSGSLPPVVASSDFVLRWEFWDSRVGRWNLLGESGPGAVGTQPNSFGDDTLGLTQNVNSKDVRFTCPEAFGACELYGQRSHWLRVRIVKGNYGSEAGYRLKDPLHPEQGYVSVLATFAPPSIQSILIGYDYTSAPGPLDFVVTANDFVVEDRSQAAATGGQSFAPYTLTGDTRPTLYLGFERPGGATGFANQATALYLGLVDALYHGTAETGAGRGEPPSVAWEFWNGSRWTHLGTRDETRGCVQRGLVTFVGPADFRSSIEFERPAFWLRARWESGVYASTPYLHRVLTNTTWAINALAVRNETLGASTGERGQVLRTTKKPVLPGQRIEIREPEAPSAAERAALEAEEGDDAVTTVVDPAGRPLEVWVRWRQVVDFYASNPRSRHYTLDRLTGEIRFGDGQRGLIPPAGANRVRAAWYQAGGGPQGNRPAGVIAQLKSAVPYIDRVTNLEPAAGGAAFETQEAVKLRGPKTLRHRDRAVALADFEDLACEASTAVARAKGIAASDGATAGHVMVIVVPYSLDLKPVPSLELISRVTEYLGARLSPTVDLQVVGPDWLQVTVSAEIVPVLLEAAADVQTAVLARLATFLHPLAGGLDGKGWDFGRRPYRSDLYALVESTPGVDHVNRLAVDTLADDGGARPDRFLVYSGDHSITVIGDSAS